MSLSTLEVRRAAITEQCPLLRMLELYQHDLSDIWDQELDSNGEYGYPLERFWQAPECHPFVALLNGHYAGFALVDGATKIASSGQWMDQFFVLKKHRRAGVGKAIALKVFSELPGYWEVGQMTGNSSAQAFWKQVIAEHTGGNYKQHALSSGWWQGVVQCFNSGTQQ
jgi:predicted acetyltransferase